MIDNGEKSIYRQILEDIKLRDKQDKNRNNSPLVIPKGATIIDNSKKFLQTLYHKLNAQWKELINGKQISK